MCMNITSHMDTLEEARFTAFIGGYLAAALWTEEPQPFPEPRWTPEMFTQRALNRAAADCLTFWDRTAHVILVAGSGPRARTSG